MKRGEIWSIETAGGHQIWMCQDEIEGRIVYGIWETKPGWYSDACLTERSDLNDALGHFAYWIQQAIEGEKPDALPLPSL